MGALVTAHIPGEGVSLATDYNADDWWTLPGEILSCFCHTLHNESFLASAMRMKIWCILKSEKL